MGNVIYHTYKTALLRAVMGLAFTPASVGSRWNLAAIKIDSMVNPTPTCGTGCHISEGSCF